MIRPVVAVTLGDPAGIGPEIVLKALRERRLREQVKLVVIGDRFALKRAADVLKDRTPIPSYSAFPNNIRTVQFPFLLDLRHPEFTIPVGRIDARCGRVSLNYIGTGIELAIKRQIDGLVTAPIHKRAWAEAGSKFTGHTELLAQATGSKDYAMAFWAKGFLTVLLSTHLPLKEALRQISQKGLGKKINLAHRSLCDMGVRQPRIAVAGINPHAGEQGLIGSEEQSLIVPAIKRAQKEGIGVTGPYPADTIYLRASRGEFDAVIAPYHDQAMLAVKTLTFGHATNITLGLPFVRTSVDHGTAFDIAGKGIARPDALIDAIAMCRKLILARRNIQ